MRVFLRTVMLSPRPACVFPPRDPVWLLRTSPRPHPCESGVLLHGARDRAASACCVLVVASTWPDGACTSHARSACKSVPGPSWCPEAPNLGFTNLSPTSLSSSCPVLTRSLAWFALCAKSSPLLSLKVPLLSDTILLSLSPQSLSGDFWDGGVLPARFKGRGRGEIDPVCWTLG